MISGFSHVGLYPADMESAIRFYTEVFAAENLGCFMTERRGCWLRLGRDVLEVFESQELPDGCFLQANVNVWTDEAHPKPLDCFYYGNAPEAPFAELQKLVKKYRLAAWNGYAKERPYEQRKRQNC